MSDKTYTVEFYTNVPEEWLREVEQYDWFQESRRIDEEQSKLGGGGFRHSDYSYTLDHIMKIIKDGEGRPEIMEIRKRCYEVVQLDRRRNFIDKLYQLYKIRKFGDGNRSIADSTLYLGFIASGRFESSDDPALIDYIKRHGFLKLRHDGEQE